MTRKAQDIVAMIERSAGAGRTSIDFGTGERRSATGSPLGRFIAGALRASKKGGNPAAAAAWVERRFGDGKTAGALAKALNTSGTATGGALIPQAFVGELIELLRATTVVRRAGPLTISLPRGNATLGRMDAGSVATYAGELDTIAVSQETFDNVQLNAKKLTALVSVSNDLLRRDPDDLDAVLRDDLLQTIARREDLAFLFGDGSSGSPVGMFTRCPAAQMLAVTPFAAYDNTTLITQVVGTLEGIRTIIEQNLAAMVRPAWISAPPTFAFLRQLRDGLGGFPFRAEIEAGRLLDVPIYSSQQIPTNLATGPVASPSMNGAYLFLVDMADVVIGDGMSVEIETSVDATYTDTTGASVSAFTGDRTLYRAITEHDLVMRRSASIVVATLPGWTPPGWGMQLDGEAFYTQAPSGDGSAAGSAWGPPPTGSNNPANIATAAPGGTQPGRP